MKRNPRERLEAQIRMHQIANMNMIRNWVGQSTSEDFYELCDKYGILVWDEFFSRILRMDLIRMILIRTWQMCATRFCGFAIMPQLFCGVRGMKDIRRRRLTMRCAF
ncbi:hypothetical protein RBB78_06505 [Tunturiibacter empetritectus]|uniref:hypothetical protein n=1 Tax=Tunturiibacter empetritectus TaxID=3069691 RepID=UPI003D9B71DD